MTEERRWLIQVCDECDELFTNIDEHRHRKGVHGIGMDIEVVPDERAEQAEASLAELRDRTLHFLDLFDRASSVDSVGGHLVAAYQEEQRLRLWIDALSAEQHSGGEER